MSTKNFGPDRNNGSGYLKIVDFNIFKLNKVMNKIL